MFPHLNSIRYLLCLFNSTFATPVVLLLSSVTSTRDSPHSFSGIPIFLFSCIYLAYQAFHILTVLLPISVHYPSSGVCAIRAGKSLIIN